MPQFLRIFCYLITVLLVSFTALSVASAKDELRHFTDAELGFSLSFPKSMRRVKKKQSEATRLLLRTRGGGYPTFNILVQPGPFEPNAISERQLKEQILTSYRLVGITDAAVVAAEKIASADDSHPLFQVRYYQGDEKFLSFVTIYPAGDRHLILTYIDKAEGEEERAAIRNEIFSSFQMGAQPTLDSQDSLPAWLVPLLAVGLLVTILIVALLVVSGKNRTSE